MLIFILFPGEEWGAQAGAILQGNLCVLCPVAAHLKSILVQCTDQMSAHLLPVGVFTGTWLQLPRCSFQRPQDLSRPHLFCPGRCLSHLAGAGLLRPRWGERNFTRSLFVTVVSSTSLTLFIWIFNLQLINLSYFNMGLLVVLAVFAIGNSKIVSWKAVKSQQGKKTCQVSKSKCTLKRKVNNSFVENILYEFTEITHRSKRKHSDWR